MVGVDWTTDVGGTFKGEIPEIGMTATVPVAELRVFWTENVAAWEELANSRDKSYLFMWSFTRLGSVCGYKTPWAVEDGVDSMKGVANGNLDSSKTTSLEI